MNKEDLFIGFGNLDEDLLRRSEQGGQNMNKKRNISKIVKYGSIAACLVVVLGVGIGAFVKTSIINQEPEKTIVVDNTGVEENDVPSIDQERFIAIDTLLASADGSQSQQAMKGCKVQIDKYTAVYEAVASVSSEQLEKSMGKEVEANEETYYVSGHNDLQYIIRKTAGTYLLWKFMYFESDEYPFKDVLSLIYDVHSEQDIKEVYVKPSDVDNTDEGKALQLEIGNVSITDSDSITSLYKVLNSLTCYGPENWDRINYGQDDGGMLNAVRNARYLTFSMANGCKLDSLKYTAVSGTFYEYGGVAYNELRKEQKDVIEEILNIDCSISEQQETEQRVSESEVNTEIQNAPADESTYQEASDYSAELTDLQNRITQAMINKELPFVTSCGIYENPDRVKTVVNTEDEDLLAKLRAFDTTGELLEIVYSSRANGLE